MVGAAARIVLAATLAVAAVTKLRHRDRVRAQITMLLPANLSATTAALLPFVELGLAAMLVAWWGSPVPGVLTGLVLLAFTTVLVRAQAQRAPCPCFGGTSTRPVGPLDVLRNGALLALAVFATAS